MPMVGDMKQFGLFRAALDKVSRVPSKVAAPAAARITEQWRASYTAGCDPYGKPWAALRPSTIRRKGHATIMVDRGDTKSLTFARAMPGAGIGLHTGPNAYYHLLPDGTRPARIVLPVYGLPKAWRETIQDVARAELGKALKGI